MPKQFICQWLKSDILALIAILASAIYMYWLILCITYDSRTFLRNENT